MINYPSFQPQAGNLQTLHPQGIQIFKTLHCYIVLVKTEKKSFFFTTVLIWSQVPIKYDIF